MRGSVEELHINWIEFVWNNVISREKKQNLKIQAQNTGKNRR